MCPIKKLTTRSISGVSRFLRLTEKLFTRLLDTQLRKKPWKMLNLTASFFRRVMKSFRNVFRLRFSFSLSTPSSFSPWRTIQVLWRFTESFLVFSFAGRRNGGVLQDYPPLRLHPEVARRGMATLGSVTGRDCGRFRFTERDAGIRLQSRPLPITESHESSSLLDPRYSMVSLIRLIFKRHENNVLKWKKEKSLAHPFGYHQPIRITDPVSARFMKNPIF